MSSFSKFLTLVRSKLNEPLYIFYGRLLRSVAILVLAIFIFTYFGNLADQSEKFDVFHYFVPPLYFLLPVVAAGVPTTLLLLIIGVIYCFKNSREEVLLIILDLIAAWLLVRTVVMIVTIPPSPEDAPWGINLFVDKILLFKKDLFYSGHAGLPYLCYLIFRRSHKQLARMFLFWSLLMGFSVLATRVHFSLDVLGAYVFTDWVHDKYKHTNIFNFDKKIVRLYREHKRKKAERETEIAKTVKGEEDDDI